MTTTRIWIEPIKRDDGRSHYSGQRGLSMWTRLDGPDVEVLCDGVFSPVVTSCRALMARGITGPFETYKPSIPYACMTGDIEKAAGLTVYEPDDQKDPRPIHFRRWRPFDAQAVRGVASENGPCGGTGLAPAREDDVVDREIAIDTIAQSSAG